MVGVLHLEITAALFNANFDMSPRRGDVFKHFAITTVYSTRIVVVRVVEFSIENA